MRSRTRTVLRLTHFITISASICIGYQAHSATLTPVSQNRSIQAMVIVPPCNPATDGDNDSAVGFGPFVSQVDAARICSMALGRSAASQNSQIDPASIKALGGTSCDVLARPNPVVIHAIPLSTCSVTFQLSHGVRYFIDGRLESASDIQMIASSARLRLTNAANQALVERVATAVPGGGPNTLTVHDSGSLVAGQYTLLISGSSMIDAMVPPSGAGESSYDITARFQRPGDANVDGSVNVDDLIAVIIAWGVCPAPPAFCPIDMDGNGSIDVDDLLLVVLNWG